MASLDFDDIPAAGKAPGVISFDDVPAAPMPRRPIPAQELTLGERLLSALPKGAQDWLSDPTVAGVSVGRGSAAHGLAMGAADPVVGGVQLLANLPGINGAISEAPTLSGLVTGNDQPSNPVNRAIDAKNAEYEAARRAQGREGFDAARLAGNVASPVNLAVGAALPVKAATTGGRILQGAAGGAAGGALAPVENADESFVAPKMGQVVTGAAAGGVLTPVAGKIGDRLLRKATLRDPSAKSAEADRILLEGVNRLRKEGFEITQHDIDQLRAQVVTALDNGEVIDPAALARKADFEALGVSPTLGQITRDPLQFAREKNLAGVSGVGEPLSMRLTAGAKRLHELIGQRSAGALDDTTAGADMIAALRKVDAKVKGGVDMAYAQARDHRGRAAPMDVGFFSKEANQVLDGEMLGGVLPASVRDILNNVTLGRIPFNVNTAVQIDQTLSRLQRGASNAEAYAIGKVRDVLNKTPIADNVGEDAKRAFDAARGLARDRFALLDRVPALKAAVEGGESADTVIRKFLINGRSEQVAALAKVLPDDAKQEARRQFGAALERAAFGANTTGDKAFAAENFAKFLVQPGMRQKLAAFFSPDEVAEIGRIARVGAYMGSHPSGAPVNTSHSASAVFNLLSRLPGVPSGVGLLTAAKNAATNQAAVRTALSARVPTSPAAPNVSPERQKLLSRILGSGAVAAGSGVGN